MPDIDKSIVDAVVKKDIPGLDKESSPTTFHANAASPSKDKDGAWSENAAEALGHVDGLAVDHDLIVAEKSGQEDLFSDSRQGGDGGDISK